MKGAIIQYYRAECLKCEWAGREMRRFFDANRELEEHLEKCEAKK